MYLKLRLQQLALVLGVLCHGAHAFLSVSAAHRDFLAPPETPACRTVYVRRLPKHRHDRSGKKGGNSLRKSKLLMYDQLMGDHTFALVSASALLQAPQILGELGYMYITFLEEEARHPQAALQHFGQWQLDRWRSPEFFVLAPYYLLVASQPRSPLSNALRSSWVPVTFYGAIFGLLGGQFGLYFYDLFEARCIVQEANCRPKLLVSHSLVLCMLFGAPFAFVSNKVTAWVQEGRVGSVVENSDVIMFSYSTLLIVFTTLVSIGLLL